MPKVPKKEPMAISCLTIGFILYGFTNNKYLTFMSAIFFLIALALSVSMLIEWYKTKKKR